MIPGLTQWLKDPALLMALWLAAAAPILPLAWGLPYATGVGLKRQERKKRKKKNKQKKGRKKRKKRQDMRFRIVLIQCRFLALFLVMWPWGSVSEQFLWFLFLSSKKKKKKKKGICFKNLPLLVVRV